MATTQIYAKLSTFSASQTSLLRKGVDVVRDKSASEQTADENVVDEPTFVSNA